MKLAWSRGVGLAAVVLASVWLSACGGGGSAGNAPTQPTPPPVATPTPGPTPEPPLSSSCAKLAVGIREPKCGDDAPDYQQDVDAAIRTLQAEQSAIFDGNLVLSVGAYYVGLIKILDRQGLCADTDGEELGVARSSSFNEQYDVLSAKNEVRFGPASYRTTCSPSAVPGAARGLVPPPAGCSLPSSREIACGREPVGQFYPDVDAAIGQVLKEKPELFDFNQWAPGSDFVLVRDMEAYTKAVMDVLSAKGYCALSDGEEIGLKKGSNAFSEQYDINLQDKYIRRGDGIYRVSCHPAAF